MSLRDDAGKLFDHYSEFLGEMTGSFSGKNPEKIPFLVFAYSGANGIKSRLVTSGLSAHKLNVLGSECKIRTELAIFSNSSKSIEALNAVLTAVAVHLLESHEFPGVHGILHGSGPVLSGGNPTFQSFYLRPPVGISSRFSVCSLGAADIEIVQLIPISIAEAHMIGCQGWEFFERAVIAQRIDLLQFDERKEVVV